MVRLINSIVCLVIFCVDTSFASTNLKPIQNLYEIQLPNKWEPTPYPERLRSLLTFQSREVIDADIVIRRLEECWSSLKDPRNNKNVYTDNYHAHCARRLFAYGNYNDEGRKKVINLLYEISKSPEFYSVKTQKFSGKVDGDEWYNNYSFIAHYAIWYAYNKQFLTITKVQTSSIENYLKHYLMATDFKLPLKFEPAKSYRGCVSKEDLSWIRSMARTTSAGVNQCGSVRYKVAIGSLVHALTTHDKELFNSAIEHLDWSTSVYDEEGFFLPYTPVTKQAQAFSYYHDQTRFVSLLVEVFASFGYDFLGYEMRHGKTVAESLELSYQIGEDFKLLGAYPGSSKLYGNRPGSSWNHVKNMSQQDFLNYDKHVLGDGQWSDDPEEARLMFANDNPRFTKSYLPDLFKKSLNYYEFPWPPMINMTAGIIYEANLPVISKRGSYLLSKGEYYEKLNKLEQSKKDKELELQKVRLEFTASYEEQQKKNEELFRAKLASWDIDESNKILTVKTPELFELGELSYIQSAANRNRYSVNVSYLRDNLGQNIISDRLFFEKSLHGIGHLELPALKLLKQSSKVKDTWRELSTKCFIGDLTFKLSNNLTSSKSDQLKCIITNAEDDDMRVFIQGALLLIEKISELAK
jgi:hypothetical protein